MPDHIIKKFQKKYGKKKGKQIYYATANKQGRDPETFEKECVVRLINDLVIENNFGIKLIPKETIILLDIDESK